jgi:hypothetical protein
MQIRGTQCKKQEQKLIQLTTATLIICEVNTTIGLLCRNLNISLSSLQKQAYKSLIIPSLEYACSVWNPYKKSLKIPKGQSESVYRRRTNNTMAKRKKDKRTNNDQQNIHIKLKIE